MGALMKYRCPVCRKIAPVSLHKLMFGPHQRYNNGFYTDCPGHKMPLAIENTHGTTEYSETTHSAKPFSVKIDRTPEDWQRLIDDAHKVGDRQHLYRRILGEE